MLKIILRFKKHFNCRYKNNLELTVSCRHITQCGCFEIDNSLLINSKEGCFLVIDITVISERSNLAH